MICSSSTANAAGGYAVAHELLSLKPRPTALDAVNNMRTVGGVAQILAWTRANELASITISGNVQEYLYDADGIRVHIGYCPGRARMR